MGPSKDVERGVSREEMLRTFEHTREYFVLETPGYDRLLRQIAPFNMPSKEGVES